MSASWIIALTIAAPSPVADEAVETPITVTGVRDENAPEPASRVLIDEATLERLQLRSVDDVLAREPGVVLSRNGAPGGVSSLRLRGADAAQTLVVIDGARANDAASPAGGFDFANLLVDGVMSVEILRGPASVAWGSDAIGGVIVVDRAVPDGLTLRAEAGTLDSRRAGGTLGGEVGPLSLGFGAAFARTGGFSSAASGSERDGADFAQAQGAARLVVAPDLAIDARLSRRRLRSDLDGYRADFTFGDTEEEQRLVETQAMLRAEHGSDRLRHSLAFTTSRTDRATFARAGERAQFESRGLSTRIAWRGEAGLANRRLRLIGGYDHDRHRAATRSAYGSDLGLVRSDALSLQAIAEVAPDLTVHGGVRQEWHERYGSNRVAALAGEWALPFARVGARYGEGFKAPTLFQVSSDPFAYGNPALTPERSREFELSLRAPRDAAIDWSLALFDRRTRDLIDFVSCSGPAQPSVCSGGTRPFGTYDNIARALARGVEARARFAVSSHWRIEANATHLVAEDRSEGTSFVGKDLPRRPRTTALAAVDYDGGVFTVGAEARYVAASFDDRANLVRLAPYVLASLRGSVALSPKVTLEGRVENLLDRNYQTAAGYNSAPRTAAVAVRARW